VNGACYRCSVAIHDCKGKKTSCYRKGLNNFIRKGNLLFLLISCTFYHSLKIIIELFIPKKGITSIELTLVIIAVGREISKNDGKQDDQ
jgi:hypothetical protein